MALVLYLALVLAYGWSVITLGRASRSPRLGAAVRGPAVRPRRLRTPARRAPVAPAIGKVIQLVERGEIARGVARRPRVQRPHAS